MVTQNVTLYKYSHSILSGPLSFQHGNHASFFFYKLKNQSWGQRLQPQELIPLRCNLISTVTSCAEGKGNKGNNS